MINKEAVELFKQLTSINKKNMTITTKTNTKMTPDERKQRVKDLACQNMKNYFDSVET